MEKIRATVLGLFGLATMWLFLSVPFDSHPVAARTTSPAVQSWQQKAPMPEPRKFEIATPLNGKIYCVASGDESSKDHGRVYEYSPVADQWTRKRRTSVARHSSGYGAVNGRIYAISGFPENEGAGPPPALTPVVEEYDPSTDNWRKRAPLPRPRSFPAGAGANGKLYAIGGVAQRDGRMFHSPWVDEYDPRADRWTAKADMPFEARAYRVAVANDKIYVIGGADRNFSTLLPDVYEYDPAIDVWIRKSPMPTPRAEFAVTVLNGKICAFGGVGGMNAVEEYDPLTDQWRTCPAMPVSNWLQVAAPLGERIYLITGWEGAWPGGRVLNAVWEYRPS